MQLSFVILLEVSYLVINYYRPKVDISMLLVQFILCCIKLMFLGNIYLNLNTVLIVFETTR